MQENCEPDKTREIRWFEIGSIPQNLTMTARNAIEAYLRDSHAKTRQTARLLGRPAKSAAAQIAAVSEDLGELR